MFRHPSRLLKFAGSQLKSEIHAIPPGTVWIADNFLYILKFFEFTAGEPKRNKSNIMPIFRLFAFISASFDVCLFSDGCVAKQFFKKPIIPNHDPAIMDRHAVPHTRMHVDLPFLRSDFGAVVRSSGEFPCNSIGRPPHPPRGKPRGP